jgi:flavin-dependent dehydrogenase
MSSGTGPSTRDLLVVGGGPAGLATGIFAALEGLTVTLFERRRFPVDKPCGEGLMPRGVELLSRMGLTVLDAHPFHGIRYVDRSSVAEARFPDGPGYGIRRTVLSRAMAARARALGVEVVESARVDSIETTATRARVNVSRQTFDGRWVVAADGLHGILRAEASSFLGARSWLPTGSLRSPRFGFRSHFRVRPWSPCVEVHWAEGGEAYVTPVGEEEVAVAFLWNERAPSWDDMISRFPTLAARLAGRPSTSKLQGAGPLRRRFTRVASGRVALVGDASGYVDAITGDGVALAFECARSLAASLATGSLLSYVEGHRRASRRYRVMAEAVLLLSLYPRLRGRVLAALAVNPDLFERLLSISSDGAPWASLGLGSVLRLAASAGAAVIE